MKKTIVKSHLRKRGKRRIRVKRHIRNIKPKHFSMGYFENPKERKKIVDRLEDDEKWIPTIENQAFRKTIRQETMGGIGMLEDMNLISSEKAREAKLNLLRSEDVDFNKIIKKRFGRPEKRRR